jgi:hypothetical protein
MAVCLVVAGPALGQRKPTVETRISNLETDIEVLKEFLQEQGGSLQKLKEKSAEVDKLKAELAKLAQSGAASAELIKKLTAELADVAGKLKAETDRVTKIEAELARRKIVFTGQLRVRPEFRVSNRYFNYELDSDRNFAGSHRARIGVDAAPADFLKARFTLQDARFWGSPVLSGQWEEGPLTDAAGQTVTVLPQDKDRSTPLGVHEAYMDIEAIKDVLAFKLGRQSWNFGAGRMIGDNDWEQAGRSFDGLDITLRYEKFLKADLLFSWIQERNAAAMSDVAFGGLYLNCPYIKGLDIDVYWLYLGDPRREGGRKVHTMGGRVGGKLAAHPALFFDLEGAVQFGEVAEGLPQDNTLKTNDHYAVAAHADLGYAIPVQWTPTIALFFDLASGDGNTSPVDAENDLSAGWIPLFPTRHGLFGKMDLWSQSNLWDLGGRVAVTPIKGLDVGLELHSMHLYSDTGHVPGGAHPDQRILEPVSTNLGFELDIDATWRLHESFALALGYGLFAPGAAIDEREEAQNEEILDPDDGNLYRYEPGDNAQWGYVQAELTF